MFLSSYGSVEEITLLRSAAGIAYGDYVFQMCLTREGFQAIPETIVSRERQMMVVVEDRRLCCWNCKQLGHISKFCPKKDPPQAPAAATVTTEAVATTVSTATISETMTAKEQDQATSKTVEEWVEVTWKKKKKSPQKTWNQPQPKQRHQPKARKKAKNKQISTSPETSETPMETATNLKRRSSGEGAAKKVCSGPTCPDDPLEGPSYAFPPKPKPLPQQAPPNLRFPPPLLSLPPPILPLPPPPPLPLPPPTSPQYRTPQHAPPEQKCSQPSQSPQPPELSHHPPQPPKTRPHQISHIARFQSHERLSQRSVLRTFSLPSLSPSSSLELFPAATPVEKEPDTHFSSPLSL